MRQLKYHTPYKLHLSTIEKADFLQHPKPEYYNRFCTVFTKYGIVTVCDFDWKHNNGRSYFTVFKTVINGFAISATFEQGNLKDRQIKWMATHFIKNIPV